MIQEVASRVTEAHFLLSSWTTAIWGHPIVLVEDDGVIRGAASSST